MALTLRPAVTGDEPQVVYVVKTVYEELGWGWDEKEYHADLYDLKRFYFDHGNAFWIAELDGHVVGTTALDRFPTIPESDTPLTLVEGRWRVATTDCSLERLYVLSSARGQGVGRALFEETLRTARAEGRKAMEIWSDKDLHDAHRMYQKAGAVIVGDRLCHDPSNAPEWGMLLEL